jgi:hypothetical protein
MIDNGTGIISNTRPVMKTPDTIDIAREEIIQAFGTHWELNDRGHQREHFEDVFQCALHIARTLDLKQHLEIDMLFAAYFHDFFAWTRINHHELAFQYFMTADHPLIVKYYGEPSSLARDTVGYACRQHRASYKGQFNDQFAELINSADRGFPGDVQKLLQRSYKHRLGTHPDMDPEERMKLCLEHMKHKAGSKGYARYPDLYMQVFAEKLKGQMEEIDNLSMESVYAGDTSWIK